MEVKLDTGIDRLVCLSFFSCLSHITTIWPVKIHFMVNFVFTHRTLNCMVGQMKHILTEQKKTDFRPEDENNVMIQYTTVRDAELSFKAQHMLLV